MGTDLLFWCIFNSYTLLILPIHCGLCIIQILWPAAIVFMCDQDRNLGSLSCSQLKETEAYPYECCIHLSRVESKTVLTAFLCDISLQQYTFHSWNIHIFVNLSGGRVLFGGLGRGIVWTHEFSSFVVNGSCGKVCLLVDWLVHADWSLSSTNKK